VESPAEVDAVTGRRLLFGNADVKICLSKPPGRRRCTAAAGDELLYVQQARRSSSTIYGALEVGDGDYVVIPTSLHIACPRRQPAAC